MMNTMFYPGQKVICINDRFHRSIHDWGDQFPVSGHVYTVRNVVNCREALTNLVGPGLLLEELKNPDDRLRFSDWRFRALCEESWAERAEAAQIAPTMAGTNTP